MFPDSSLTDTRQRVEKIRALVSGTRRTLMEVPASRGRPAERTAERPMGRPERMGSWGRWLRVLRRQDRVPDDGRDLLELHDAPVLTGQLEELLSMSVVDDADRRELDPDDRIDGGQVGPVEVDVMNER